MAPGDKCLVCNNDKITFYLKCKDHLVSGEEFDLCICDNCGFIFTMNQPSEQDTGKYYIGDDYISHSDTKKGLTNILFHFTRNLMLYRKRNIIYKTTGLRSGTLLDMGCGTGYFAAFMKEEGWDVTGLETNENAREYAINKFNLNVITDTEIAEYSDSLFNCITLWHVMEHLREPVKYISEISRLLKPGGIFLAALPNCSSYDAKSYREFWAAWDVPRHLWHFTPATFSLFIEKTGFKVMGILPLPLDVFYISILSEKYKGSKMHFIAGMLKGLWFSILILFNKHRSSSLIYILRK